MRVMTEDESCAYITPIWIDYVIAQKGKGKGSH
jgi:hypothetical protein